jgi:hypothetical protein
MGFCLLFVLEIDFADTRPLQPEESVRSFQRNANTFDASLSHGLRLRRFQRTAHRRTRFAGVLAQLFNCNVSHGLLEPASFTSGDTADCAHDEAGKKRCDDCENLFHA